MKETMNIAYIITNENRALLEASVASLKANVKSSQLNIQYFENKNLFEAAKSFTGSRLMVVSPSVFFNYDVEAIYNSIDDTTAVVGTMHPLKSFVEFRNYVTYGLKLNAATFISEQLLILNLDMLHKMDVFTKYDELTLDQKNSYVNPAEDYLNIVMAGKIRVLDNSALATPGQNIEEPAAVTYAYTGKPWENRDSEYSDIYGRYSELVTESIKGQSIRAIAEKYKNHIAPITSGILAFAM